MPASVRTTSKRLIDTDVGTTYQLMLRADHRNDALADELLARAEAYLRERGAKVIYAGGIRPLNAFYLGLYGGSELPGVLASDPVLQRGLPAQRLSRNRPRRRPAARTGAASGRPSRERSGSSAAKSAASEMHMSAASQSWWEACTTGAFERIRFFARAVGGGQPLADVWFLGHRAALDSLGRCRPPACSISACRTIAAGKGLATFLLSEAFDGSATAASCSSKRKRCSNNTPALALYEKLGFTKVDEGIVYRKE